MQIKKQNLLLFALETKGIWWNFLVSWVQQPKQLD